MRLIVRDIGAGKKRLKQDQQAQVQLAWVADIMRRSDKPLDLDELLTATGHRTPAEATQSAEDEIRLNLRRQRVARMWAQAEEELARKQAGKPAS